MGGVRKFRTWEATVIVTDHPDWRGFIARIRANPADDLPRLVAADWLEEHGEEGLADGVRRGCARPDRWSRAEVTDLGRFAAGLPAAGYVLPCGHPRDDRDGPGPSADAGALLWLNRGFFAAVACSAAAWVAHGDAVLAWQPVERVRLTTVPVTNSGPDGWHIVGDRTGFRRPFGRVWGRHSEPDVILPMVVCEERWPGVEFELPPPLRGQVDWHFTAEAGEDVRAGQPVGWDPGGRVRPFRASVEGTLPLPGDG